MKPYKKIFKEAKSATDFVMDNIDLLDDHDIRDVYRKVVQAKFKKEFGYFLDQRFEVDSIGFKASPYDSWETVVEKWNKFNADTSVSSDDLKLKDAFNYPMQYIYDIDSRKGMIKAGGYLNMSDLLYVLDYLINGRLERDYQRANKIADDIREDNNVDNGFGGMGIAAIYGGYDFFIPEMKKLHMKVYKNGKIAIKGLSQDQWSEFQRLSTLSKAR